MNGWRWLYLLVALSLLTPRIAAAAEIRLYTIDKFGRQDAISLWGKGAKPGCHNFRKAKEIYRVAVIGKGACAIYSEPDCAPQSKVPAKWKNRKKATTLLTPGSQWLFGEKEKVVIIRPEVDAIPEPLEHATEAGQEQPGKNASGNRSAVSEVAVGSYAVEQTDETRKIEAGPRREAIHIPLTTDVRSWQCVDSY